MNRPELIIQDFQGAHNGDLEKTRARLIKGGSWKRQNIVVVIPAGDTIPAKVVLSWMNLAFPPNNCVARILAQGMEVGDAYSTAIEQVITHPEFSKWPYVLTLEHDNAPASDAVLRLLEQMEEHPELSCISALYFLKGPGGCAQIWGDINDPLPNSRPQLPDPKGGLVECQGTGMGVALWRMKMFQDKRIERPLFKTHVGKNGEGIGTQDLTFWMKARKLGYRCAVDCSVKCGHYDMKGDFGPPDTMW